MVDDPGHGHPPVVAVGIAGASVIFAVEDHLDPCRLSADLGSDNNLARVVVDQGRDLGLKREDLSKESLAARSRPLAELATSFFEDREVALRERDDLRKTLG